MSKPVNQNSNGETLIKQGYLLASLSALLLLFGVYSSLLSPLFSFFEIPPVSLAKLCPTYVLENCSLGWAA
jgi:hypothetical protein